MKRSFLFLTATAFLFSCGNMVRNEAGDGDADSIPVAAAPIDTTPARPAANENLVVHTAQDLIGNWVGMFEPDTAIDGIYTGEKAAWDYSNKINLSIDAIRGKEVTGHSVVAGNDRPFAGTLKTEGNTFSLLLKEPGDDQYDGIFLCAISKGDSIIAGGWKANKQIRIQTRKYALQKRVFRYNPGWQLETGQYVDWNKRKKSKYDFEGETGYDDSYFTTTEEVHNFNASTTLLTSGQVSNMKKADLFILRNAIYARHGYSFKNQQLRAYFDRQPWYIPVSADIKSQFTDIEKKNIELLLRYEKNAKEYYDVFGRG